MMDNILLELRKFSESILEVNPPVDPKTIEYFERAHQLVSPSDYKCFLQVYNRVTPIGATVYGIFGKVLPVSLEDAYQFEHYNARNSVPLELVPFSPMAGGIIIVLIQQPWKMAKNVRSLLAARLYI